MNGLFKICSIGCGQMAENGHGPAFRKYKNDRSDVSLAACCDIDEGRARAFMEKFGFEKYYTDYRQMIEEIRPDAVSLISPVHLTAKIAAEVIKMGCNIILEKPPGQNREEIEELMSIAEETGVRVRVAFNRRYTPLISKLVEQLKECGERPTAITYQMYRYNRHERDFSTTAIHAIDVVKYIAGSDYKSVSFRYDEHPELGEGVKNIFLDAKMENGALVSIALVPTGGAVIERLTVNTLGHSYFVDIPVWDNMDVPGRLVSVSKIREIDTVTGDRLSDSTEMFELTGFYDENRRFFDDVRLGAGEMSDLESAIQSVEIEDCVRHSLPFYNKG